MDTSADGVHRQNGILGVESPGTIRMKFVLYVAAGIGAREVTENLVNPKKESGEDYARRILEFLRTAKEENQRKKKEEDNGTKWNVSAGVFYPAREKEETEKNDGT